MSVNLKGLKAVQKKNDKRGKDASKELTIAMNRAVSIVEAHVLKSIKQKGTGRVYPRKRQPPCFSRFGCSRWRKRSIICCLRVA